MIYIVHGDDFVKSRALIVNQQKKLGVESKTEINVSEISPLELYEKCSAAGLFGDLPFIVLNISDAGNKNLEPYLETAKKIPSDATLIILSSKSLPKTNVFIKNAQTLDAKIHTNEKTPEGNVFRFVDTLFTKNRKSAYKELNNLLTENNDPFYIFSMILYGLRNIAGYIFGSPSFHKQKPFVKGKAKTQSAGFSENKIKNLYFYLYNLEKKAKTGEITPDLLLTLTVEKVLNS